MDRSEPLAVPADDEDQGSYSSSSPRPSRWGTLARPRVVLLVLVVVLAGVIGIVVALNRDRHHGTGARNGTPISSGPSALPTTGTPQPLPAGSFGPNGTHWPSRTPWPGSPGLVVKEATASYGSIAAAIASVTVAQNAQGVVIRVSPGTLVGEGNISDIKFVGSAGWTRRIVVMPRDGLGTVVIKNGMRVFDVPNVVWAGLVGDSFRIAASSGAVLAWSKFSNNATITSYPGYPTSDTGFVEVVNTNFSVNNQDVADLAADRAPLTGAFVIGSYLAPHFYDVRTHPCGAQNPPHTDSLQLLTPSSTMTGTIIRDSAIFASTNSAIQLGSATKTVIDHNFIIGGTQQGGRYGRLPNGENGDGTPCKGSDGSAINGGGSGHVVTNSVVAGAIRFSARTSQQRWTSTAGSVAIAQPPAAFGPSFEIVSVGDALTRLPRIPDSAYLDRVWTLTATTRPSASTSPTPALTSTPR